MHDVNNRLLARQFPRPGLTLILPLVLVFAGAILAVAAAGDVDPTFNPGANIFEVHSLPIQPDGKVLVLNRFLLLNGSIRGTLARLNNDGTPDPSFLTDGSQTNGDIRTIALQSDGKILFAGRFSTAGGVRHNNIARLNSDGSLDANFRTLVQEQSPRAHVVYALAVQPDDKILVAGDFVSVNGTQRNGLARLNRDGSLDATFANLNLGQNIIFTNILLQPDSKILVGYGFNLPDGQVRRGVARLNNDGTQDATFLSSSSDLNSEIYALALQADGKVLVGGIFSRVKGVDRSYLARLNHDGTLDTSFLVTISAPVSEPRSIYNITVQRDDKIIVGGAYRTINGAVRNNLARLRPDGSVDETFLSIGSGPNGAVFTTTLQPDGRILIGGQFTEVSAVPRRKAARLLNDGAPAAAHSVAGRVTDAGGSGVSDVTVLMIGDLTGTHVAQTDGGGRFTFVHSFNHSVTVIPAKSGFTFSPQMMKFISPDILTEDFTADFTATLATDPSPVPVLLTEGYSLRALALDSVTSLREPFAIDSMHNFSSDQRTRLSLFAANLEVRPGESVQTLTVQAQDAQQRVSQLPVEFIGPVPNVGWLTQIVVSLPEELRNAGDVRLRLILRGKVSNEASIRVR